jgi:phospholipase/carboxylesterase
MSRSRPALAFTAAIFAAACKPTAEASAPDAGLEFVEMITGGANTSETLPMIVAIHGLGDRPEALRMLFDGFESRARVILPRAPSVWGDGHSWFEVDPRRGADSVRAEALASAESLLAAHLAAWTRTRPTIGKPIVTGFSQGGMLSFLLAVRHPELIDRAYPLGGWLPESLWPPPERARAIAPILAFHGAEDRVVPHAATAAMVAAWKQRGLRVDLISEPGVAHFVSRKMHASLLTELRARTAAVLTATAASN